jgi:hypothetical protein
MDWADPIPKSIAQRVLDRVALVGRGIILFHDIHSRAAEVLPSLIETLEQQGYRFASWKGDNFSPETGAVVQTAAAGSGSFESPYRESWAAVIGIDDYQSCAMR